VCGACGVQGRRVVICGQGAQSAVVCQIPGVDRQVTGLSYNDQGKRRVDRPAAVGRGR